MICMTSKTNGFVLSKRTPAHLRILMSEGHKLPDSPTPHQLHRACVIGCRIGRKKNGVRVKCPSRISPTKRWTTAEAWEWYQDQLNGDE